MMVIVVLAVLCLMAARARARWTSLVLHGAMLAMCAGLFLHIMPGFDNPRLVSDVVLGPGSIPYTKYLNIDKGLAGVLLLGIYVWRRHPEYVRRSPGTGFPWRFGVLVAAVLPLALVLGYVQWDPKLPPWWPAWIL